MMIWIEKLGNQVDDIDKNVNIYMNIKYIHITIKIK